MRNEMRFVQDDDGHWYFIANDDVEKFCRLLDAQDYDEFNSLFSVFNCMHPSQYAIIEARSIVR